MKWLIAILSAVLQALLPKDERPSSPTAEDAAADRTVKSTLRRRIRERWFPLILVMLLVGCAGTRTVYVPHGEPVRLRQTVRNVKVWVLDASGKPVPAVMDLPEAWYCLPYEQEK